MPVPSPRLFLRRWLAALAGATRIPVTGSLGTWADLQPEIAAESARHLPGVGVVVGMAACMVFAIVSLPLPLTPLSPLVAGIACIVASVLLTGGRHERGLARWAAGGEPWGGTLALLLVLAAKLALLGVLGLQSAAGVMAALLAGHTVSRFWPLLLTGTRALAIAALWCVVPLSLMLLAGGLPFLLLALVASGAAFAVLRKRLREAPDGVHAMQQVGEVAFYLGAAFGVGR